MNLFMKIKDISLKDFNLFCKDFPLKSHYQTMNYALLMSEEGFEHEFIGYVDENDNIKAASLILFKTIKGRLKYGYAPKGFILDYFDFSLLLNFTNAVKDYYKRRNVCFIKINPEIAISEVLDDKRIFNGNEVIIQNLLKSGYIKLKDNLYFESMFPRFNGIIPLKEFDLANVNKNTRNKVKRSMLKGLVLEEAKRSGMDILENFIKRKRDCNQFYYKDYYNAFHHDDMVDLFLISIDPKEYLLNSRNLYEAEQEKNAKLNALLIKNNTNKNVNKKMMSDKKLLAYKNDIALATALNKKQEKIYIGGALVVRYFNRVNILISGYDKKYKSFNPNYFLHYKLIMHYQKDFDYLDLNGMTGDFDKKNPYYGLNQFKLGFKPKVYEFIGEFDLPIKMHAYKNLKSSGQLAKMFNKTNLKNLPK